jgi:sugar diacid utilization regulator
LSRIAARARGLGFDLAAAHTPLVCRRLGPESVSPRGSAMERTVAELQQAFLDSYGLCVPGGRPRTLMGALSERELLVFVPTIDRSLLEALATRVVRKGTIPGRPVTVGIGPVCNRPEEYAENAKRACWAAEILQVGHLEHQVAFFDDLGVYALLFNSEHADDLEKFVRHWIGPLIDYDEKRRGDLTLTLATLLEGRGLRQTAERLVIHVSTLKYRIKRIREILALDYQDPEKAFNLQLAVRLFNVSRARRNPAA